MARPIKLGLDYFPMDTTFFQNIRIRRLIKEHGFSGLALYLNLVCDIYANSYYLQIDSDYYFIMSDQIGKTEDELRKQIATMYKIGLFEKQFETEGVVTSKEIQEIYFAVKNRNKILSRLETKYLLNRINGPFSGVSAAETPNKRDYGVFNTLQTGVSAAESTQSKVNESKENKSKGERKKSKVKQSIANNLSNQNEHTLIYKDNWDQWKDELLNDEDWCATLVRFSGKGTAILQQAYQSMCLFDDYLILKAQESTAATKKEYQSSFIGWWRYNNWALDKDELTRSKTKCVEMHVKEKVAPARKSRLEELMEAGEEAKRMMAERRNDESGQAA